MEFEVTNIRYDTDGIKIKIPKTMKIIVPDDVVNEGYDAIEQHISDEISNRTGYCHLGYCTTPKIPE